MMLECQRFPLSCACGHTAERFPGRLVSNYQPLCQNCGRDLTATQNILLNDILLAEGALDCDLAELRSRPLDPSMYPRPFEVSRRLDITEPIELPDRK